MSRLPRPRDLWQGFLETHVYTPALPFLIGIALLLMFGEPIAHWYASH